MNKCHDSTKPAVMTERDDVVHYCKECDILLCAACKGAYEDIDQHGLKEITVGELIDQKVVPTCSGRTFTGCATSKKYDECSI